MSESTMQPADPVSYGRDLDAAALEQVAVNTLRGLAMDGTQTAKSGHPGMPMGMADAAYVLWTRFLKFSPRNPLWPNRDRFVLSAGHGSMLLYALLHLSGYGLTMEDLKTFRHLNHKTAGHPEVNQEIGIETTTGPLGQGFANGVGMALAEAIAAAQYNVEGEKPVVDHYIYAICSDGDLMEGISHEAASLAGHLGLGRIIYLYDSNHISIEGSTDLAYTEDTPRRFQAYGWHVQSVDGHDRAAVAAAIRKAQRQKERPSIIVCRTHIGFGSPHKQDTASAHGEPLGEDEVRATKEALGIPLEPAFFVPDAVRELFRAAAGKGDRQAKQWQRQFEAWRAAHPDLAARWQAAMDRALPADLAAKLPSYEAGKEVATRNASGDALQVLSAEVPGLIGGSADLSPSTKTNIKNSPSIEKGAYTGKNLHFGVREHAMGGMLNGMSLYGGLRPYGGTFLIFSDYMRPSVRLAAVMKQPVIYVWTHDSIFLGEDGPTHQPIEHFMALRAIPNLVTIRPADASETGEAWLAALARTDGPTALWLTRQNIPVLDRAELAPATMLHKGGYVLLDAPDPELIIIATGSEVFISLAAARTLNGEGRRVRAVNLASWELFDAQPQEYRDRVLPPAITKRLSVEAGITLGWERYTGPHGRAKGIDHFGESGPWKMVAEKYGFTADAIAEIAREMLG
jgi:transketolase